MLCDAPRQKAYREAILSNKSLFNGKTVLDVGAGTGILSVFCAQAGAKKVYAIEASNMAKLAKTIVQENGYENVIEVHQTKIEDFHLPNTEDQQKIDIIVSEWMGFYLLHEGMLDSVICARDKFLKPTGLMFPKTATILFAPCQLPSLFDSWESHDGVKMSAFGAALRAQKSLKPEIMNVPPTDLLHSGTVIAWFDLNEVTLEELEKITLNDVVVVDRSGRYQGLCLWFEVSFPTDDPFTDTHLNTSPECDATHWKQTVILLPDNVREELEANDAIALNLEIARSEENLRHYKLELTILDPNEEEHTVPCDCNLTKCILSKEHLKLLERQEAGDAGDVSMDQKTELRR